LVPQTMNSCKWQTLRKYPPNESQVVLFSFFSSQIRDSQFWREHSVLLSLCTQQLQKWILISKKRN
jgi:hypothetical protein